MRRRVVLALLGGAAGLLPFSARSQQKPMPVIGILAPRKVGPDFDPGIDAFRHGLRELGYLEGRDILVEFRYSDGENERLPALAAELAALKPDLIVTFGEPAIRAAKEAAGGIPIIMSVVGDPVAAGFAQSLAHPGGNLTGLTNLSTGLVSKRLELLLEIVPTPGCVAVLRDPANQALDALAWGEITTAAQTLRAVLEPIMMGSANDLEAGFAEIARRGCRALLVLASPVFIGMRQPLVAFSAEHRIPASYDNRLFVDAGGLISYGPNTSEMQRRAALYVDKILKGANRPIFRLNNPRDSNWSST